MSKYDSILAKSERNGGTSLRSHLELVASFAGEAARYASMDEEIARIGGLLHDIGKASPEFQRRLTTAVDPTAKPFRHELASLFFLKMVDTSIWPPLIEMIVAHHKSVKCMDPNGSRRGFLDLVYDYEENFDIHVKGFETWSKDACGLLEELGMTTSALSQEDAREAYQYAIAYCRGKGKNWSPWKGLLMGADHFASAVGDFHGHIPRLFAMPDTAFYNRKHALYPLSLIPSDEGKRHTFVKAPTGAGKTDFLMKRCRGRIFYILPFQASINAMFERI
ncbi:MAG: CRISPR-associated endonuclease Cas3'', partial [Prevotellaceae bacterium]|nr:CRISPR-associated endonuclease Cas3'' [Prevotellaceae bacterium]